MEEKRYLIVIENKETEERFLWHPFTKGKPVVPNGYYKITQDVPLNEEKFGSLPVLEIKENRIINSGEMTDVLEYKKVAKCVAGNLEGLHATKNEKGHVIIIEEDIAYDFWDSSFSKCKWEIETL